MIVGYDVVRQYLDSNSLRSRMKQRFERKGIKIPVSAKNGILLFVGFCAWHYLGVTYYNAVSARGQDELRREGVPESEINKRKY